MISRDSQLPRLETDDIDDVLYAVRINDQGELEQYLKAVATKYNVKEKDVLLASVAADSGNTALHYAAANGHNDLLAYILSISNSSSDNSVVNIRNAAGNTPLHWSSLNGHMETTKTLVSAGADLWVRNQAGNLAVFEAERAEKDDIVAYLLRVGGNGKDGEEAEGEPSDTLEGTEEVTVSETVDNAADEMATTSLKD